MSTTTHTMVNLRQLATMLHLSPHTIRHWRKANPRRGPRAVKLTASPKGRILFPIEEVDAWRTNPLAYEREHYGEHHGRD